MTQMVTFFDKADAEKFAAEFRGYGKQVEIAEGIAPMSRSTAWFVFITF